MRRTEVMVRETVKQLVRLRRRTTLVPPRVREACPLLLFLLRKEAITLTNWGGGAAGQRRSLGLR